MRNFWPSSISYVGRQESISLLEQWNIMARIDMDPVAYSDHDPVIFVADKKIYNKLHHHHPSIRLGSKRENVSGIMIAVIQ